MLQCTSSDALDYSYCTYWPLCEDFDNVLRLGPGHWGWNANSLPDSALQHAPTLMGPLRKSIAHRAGACSAKEFAAAMGEHKTQQQPQPPPGSDIWLPLMVMQLYQGDWTLFCRYLTQHGPAEYRVGQCGEELV